MSDYIPTTVKSAAVKKALVAAFPDASVSVIRGSGSTSRWITSRVTIPRPACTECDRSSHYARCGNCRVVVNAVYKKVQEIGTAALKDMGGFDSFYSDDYSDPTPYECHSISIEFAREK